MVKLELNLNEKISPSEDQYKSESRESDYLDDKE